MCIQSGGGLGHLAQDGVPGSVVDFVLLVRIGGSRVCPQVTVDKVPKKQGAKNEPDMKHWGKKQRA